MTTIRRSRMRTITGVAKWSALTLSLLLLLVWAASLRYHAGLVGRPFNHAYSISGGELCIAWFSREPNGSTSGFGNPGWKLRPRDERWVRWRPHLWTSATGTHHQAVLPLWPLPVLLGGGAWRLHRAHRRLNNPSLCPSCGYSRQGLPKQTPCPECGTLSRLRSAARVCWRSMSRHLAAASSMDCRVAHVSADHRQ